MRARVSKTKHKVKKQGGGGSITESAENQQVLKTLPEVISSCN